MDGFGPHHDGVEQELEVAMESPPLVQFDERRMHVRAYNYWVSLLGERTFPSIEDLNPADIEDFGPHSVLLDFTSGIDNPAIAYLGSALSQECGIDSSLQNIDDVPSRTLLSRLTDHYLQIIANEAPVGFEAEFTNQRGVEVLYRGILMPFSTDDDTIDFVYGVINWKEVANPLLTDDIQRAMGELAGIFELPLEAALWPSDGGRFDLASPSEEEAEEHAAIGDDIGDRLAAARTAAADALSAEGRGHQALYRAIGLAHSFALVARERADDYAELLADADIVVQQRSPMTALVKLVFGAGYDKTRLSEFSVAIDHGLNEGVGAGLFAAHITAYPGGFKAYVRDARAAKRGPAKAPLDRTVAARKRLGAAPAITLDRIATDADGLAVIVVRRVGDGSFEAVGGFAGDDRRAAPFLQAISQQL